MTFAITQARPAKKLGPSRPTAKPVGPQTLASCLGVVFINFWFIVGRYELIRFKSKAKDDISHTSSLSFKASSGFSSRIGLSATNSTAVLLTLQSGGCWATTMKQKLSLWLFCSSSSTTALLSTLDQYSVSRGGATTFLCLSGAASL